MTNTELLRKTLSEKGLSITFVASLIGISRQAFYRKINNDTEFTTTEITKICKAIGINSLREREKIFFAKDVT